jgi:NTE family protein
MAVGKSRFIDLVCEGGGVRGIALVGALEVLEEEGYVVQNRAGTSAGAIVATLHAAGFKAGELHAIIKQTKFTSFVDLGLLDLVPPAGIIYEHGVYEGDAFLKWFRSLLRKKDVETFGDLVHPDYADQDPVYRHKVQVIATDLSSRQLLVLPRDADKLGIDNPDELDVALAVRMSMSIPFFFEPVRFTNRQTRKTHVIVDGGVLSNYPVWLFDSDGSPQWPTFGLRLVEEDAASDAIAEPLEEMRRLRKGPIGFYRFGKSLIETMMTAHDRLYIEEAQFARTIPIPTCGISTINFRLSSEDAERLYESGREAAKEFLKRWNFDGYKREYGRGKNHSRTTDVGAALQVTS